MPGAEGELEGSSTKYLQDQIGSDEDGTSPTAVTSSEPQAAAVTKEEASEKVPKYVEVDPLTLNVDEQPKSKPQPQQGSVEYVKLKKAPAIEVRKPSKVRSEPTRTVRGEKGMYILLCTCMCIEYLKPQVPSEIMVILLYSVESPPPPSRPPKGIIKNKFKNIGEGLRRLKKQRVQIKTGKEARHIYRL